MEHQELVRSQTFLELEPALQKELVDLVSWDKRAMERTMNTPPEGFSKLINLTSSMRLTGSDVST